MQKITLLLLLFLTNLALSQTTIYEESFETESNGTNYTTSIDEFTDGGSDYFTRTDGSNLGGNINISGTEGAFFFGAMDIDGEGATLPVTLSTTSIDVSSINSVDFVVLLAEDADGTNLDWDAEDYVHMTYSLDGGAAQNLLWVEADIETGTNGNAAEDTDFDGLGDGIVLTDVLTEFYKTIDVSSASTIMITVEFSLNSGDEDIAIDNIRLIDGFVANPSITISSPNDASIFAPGTSTVDVEFIANNLGENDQVDITVNGTTTTNVTSPFSISTTNGSNYDVQIDVISSGSSVATDNISFNVGELIQVTDITALRADVDANGLGRFYEITGDVTFTHADSFRNRKWFQDTTPTGMFIEDEDGIIANDAYTIGDQVSGLRGFTKDVNGVLTLQPTGDSGSIAGSETVEPLVLTLADFLANYETYESLLVGFEDITFTDGDGTAVFETGTNYEFGNLTDTAIVRTSFFNADYIGEIIPNTTLSGLVGLVAEFNGTPQLYPRSGADIGATFSINDIVASTFSIYPNPVQNGYVHIQNLKDAPFDVEIYSILGEKVLHTTIMSSNRLNVETLQSGVYYMKITQNGNSTTKKMIIK